MIVVHKEGIKTCCFHIADNGKCLCGCENAKPTLVSIDVWKGLSLEGLPNCYCQTCKTIGMEKGIL